MNTQRLLNIITYIEKHPEQYDQDSYTSDCGTRHCIAGFAAIAHDKLHLNKKDWDFTPVSDPPRHKAIIYLGISQAEGDYLFHPYRTLDEIREFARSGGIYQLDRVDCRHYS